MPFLVLEGLDGAGKSTQVKMIKEYLAQSGHKVEYLHFPRFDAPVFGDMIARFLKGEFGDAASVDPYFVALLYAEDRAHASTQINKWLEDGCYVLVDRYVFSNIGYQCAKVEDAAKRAELCEWILNLEYEYFKLPKPDVSLFLDVPFAFTCSKLTGERSGDDRSYLDGADDIHEKSLDLQACVREVYLDSAQKYGDYIKVVDCSDEDNQMASAQTIFSRIKPYL
ncbi:MAG: dTMP kinase [Rikenellaceae bacterium]